MNSGIKHAGAPTTTPVARDSLSPTNRLASDPGTPGHLTPEWPNLAGNWTGFYPGYFDEVICIEQNGPLLKAIKITGDDHVPAGEITWRADLRTLQGEGQVADRKFRNAQFVPGSLVIESSDRMRFTWHDDGGAVTYRRGGTAEPPPRKSGSMLSELFRRMFGSD